MSLGTFFNLATKFLGGAGAPTQQLQREVPPQQQPPTTPLEQVNASIGKANPQEGEDALSRQALQKLSITETTTAPTTPAEISAPTDTAAVAKTNLAETTPAAIELRISQTAVESFKPILSALKSLVQSILPELNLQELAATAKPVLRTLLSPATSNPAGTQAAAPNPA
jgi:cytoskeletal protein RodZ